MKNRPSITRLERAIGVKTKDWPGHCHEIAHLVVASGLIEGHAVYGFYGGPVHRLSRFYERKQGFGVVRHGWILGADGATIYDPTRWVFEHVDPYLFFTTPIFSSWNEYDEGMNRFRTALIRPPPGPDDKPKGDVVTKPPMHLPVSKVCDDFLSSMLVNGRRKDGKLTHFQLFWIANTPYDLLGMFAPEVYRGLRELGMEAFVSKDNQLRAKRESEP